MLCEMNMLVARRKRSDRIVVDIRERFRASSWVCRELMNRRKLNPGIVRDDRFRSVAVVPIKIPNGNAFSTVFQCVERSDGNIAKITEPHCAISCGVMPGRSHQTKRGFAMQRRARCLNGSAGRMTRVRFDVRIKRCIEIEIFPPVSDAFEMLK